MEMETPLPPNAIPPIQPPVGGQGEPAPEDQPGTVAVADNPLNENLKKSLGVYGFYINIVALMFLLLAGLAIALLALLFIVTFGFIDSTGPVLDFIMNFPKVGLNISFWISILSIPFIFGGFLQFARARELYFGHKRMFVGLVIGVLIMIIYGGINAISRVRSEQAEERYQEYLVESKEKEFTCTESVCDSISYSKEDNVLSFTLINEKDERIVLNGLYDTGSCSGGVLKSYKREGDSEPVILNKIIGFDIELEPRERMDLSIECKNGVVAKSTGFFGGQVGFLFTMGAKSNLYYHVYYSGPRLQ